jgi:hypothetical protein
MKSLAAKQRAAMAKVRAAMVGHELVACPPPGTLKFAAATITVPAGGTATARVVTPGAFCPVSMYLVSDDLELILVSSIHVGLEEQIVNRQPGTGITGVLPATMFGTENHCCPTRCLPCLCVPEVPFEVDLFNSDITDEDVTVVLVGTYTEACLPADVPFCYDKYVGFVANLSTGQEATIRITTPGRFCPRNMFLETSTELFGLITGIKSGLKEQIISGSLDMSLFSTANKCCILSCFDCLCMPGYPLEITLFNNNAEGPLVVFGGLVGTYEDACT